MGQTGSAQVGAVWYALDVIAESDAREAVEYALMEAGALGAETNDGSDGQLLITGYFEVTPSRELVRDQLQQALHIYSLPTSAVLDMKVREVVNRDWLEEWKKSWQPVDVGRFTIAPPWTEVTASPDRFVIRIEPGMAFGTGTHETTRLCLDAIQTQYQGGSFLDVGTGTGILAIAAAKLHPEARIQACDTDAEAVSIARENAVANGVDNIEFEVGSVTETTPSADLVCANLTADVIVSILPTLVGATCGRLILSGILETQTKLIADALNAQGINEFEVVQDGEWVAFTL
jgi:ribosomal protein L11 methyltransferase